MHSIDSLSSHSESFPTPLPLSEIYQRAYFKDFDSAANNYETASDATADADFDLPYDHNHRPTSTLNFEHFLPDVKALHILNPDDSPPSTPERGRSLHREAYSNQITFVAPSPPRHSIRRTQASLERAKAVKKPVQDIKSEPDQPNLPPRLSTLLGAMSRNTEASSDTSSVFDEPTFNPDEADQYTEPTRINSRGASADDAPGSYDLKPPPPAHSHENIEFLSERLFSADHLKLILKEPSFASRFQTFLAKYRPDSRRALAQYINVQKAITAVDYANAIAEAIGGLGSTVAHIDESLEGRTKESVNDLVNNALPGYVTHRLVQIVTEVLVREITGQNTPIMRELVNGLAEVYCLTDPALPDNPIVYASEEFYRCTQYGRNYVIGRNCRFLQGPKSSGASVQRLIDALSEGQEICETILNYRRDGSPFMNLLMIAPLYDNKGSVRYFIGAQIDVNGLIEGGRGLDSFEKLLQEDRHDERYGGRRMGKTPEQCLSDLGGLWDDDDMEALQSRGARKSKQGSQSGSGTSTPMRKPQGTSRRFVGMDDPTDRGLWPAPSLGPSGRLPGVFQNYLLIRPYPSLRITFTSPALRIPGLLQSKFLDRIGGAARIRDQILDALSSGVGVTAKITWLTNASATTSGDKDGSNQGGSYHEDDNEGRQRWIHCTPLLGSDEKVGVWMVVMVENETVTGTLSQNGRRVAGSTITSNSNTYDLSSHRNQGRKPNGVNGNDGASESQSQRGRDRNAPTGSLARDGIQRARDAKAAARRDPSQHTPGSSQGNHYNAATAPSIPQQRPRGLSNHQGQPGYTVQSSGQYQGDVARSGYGSPKQFPGELKPISTAYGATAGSQRGASGQQEGKEVMARKLAERATAGEESFRDF